MTETTTSATAELEIETVLEIITADLADPRSAIREGEVTVQWGFILRSAARRGEQKWVAAEDTSTLGDPPAMIRTRKLIEYELIELH